MTDLKQNYDINNMLEPIDIDLDKLFSLSYTFDNLKSFMKHMINNQQIIADKINELEKRSLQQKEDNKKNHLFQNNIDKRLKTIEIGTAKTKKEMQSMKQKQEEQAKSKKNIQKDVTDESDTDKKKGDKESKVDKLDKQDKQDKEEKEDKEEKVNKLTSDKRIKYKLSGKENYYDSDHNIEDDNESNENENDFFVSNQEIQEIKERLDNLEKKLNTQKNNLIFKPTEFLMDDKKGDMDIIKLEIKALKQRTETYKIESDDLKKKWKKSQ